MPRTLVGQRDRRRADVAAPGRTRRTGRPGCRQTASRCPRRSMICISWNPSTTFGIDLADADVQEVLGAERRVERDVGVLELGRDRRVGVLGEGDLGEIGDVVAERAGAEDVHFLRELEVVVRRGDRAVRVQRGRVDVGELDVDGERHGAGDFSGPDRVRPEPLVGRRAEADRLLLHHVLGLARHAVAPQPERHAECIELREDRVARLAARPVLAGERGDRTRRPDAPHARADHGQRRDAQRNTPAGTQQVSHDIHSLDNSD